MNDAGAPRAGELVVRAPDGLPEITEGTDLAAAVVEALRGAYGPDAVLHGDIVVVTSKVVSKAEGRVVDGEREAWIDRESVRDVARRGPTRIVRHRLGLVMAAAGIDASNVAAGSVVLLPEDPDRSARALRRRIGELTGAVVGVIVTDTAGRAWREGQTDIAIGAAGVVVAESFVGRVDGHGNELAVTAPAVADEIASAIELAQGKLGGRPCGSLRGRADLVLPADDDGPGAAALIRPEGGDLFGWGAREAVVRAVAAAPGDRAAFGSPVEADDLVAALSRAGLTAHAPDPATVVVDGDGDGVRAVAFAHGWEPVRTPEDHTDRGAGGTDLRLRPVST